MLIIAVLIKLNVVYNPYPKHLFINIVYYLFDK